MEIIEVVGGNPLEGEIRIPSAKNSVLPIIAASLLCEEEIVIKNCPNLSDVRAMMRIVEATGGKAEMIGSNLSLCCRDTTSERVEAELTGEIRSSFFILGPILSRFRYAEVSYPGGCEIGLRPIDLHISGLKKMGVIISEANGHVICDGRNMRAAEITLDFPSVGATENVMMAAVLVDGKTVIRNAAREPEIADLANFINAIGGKVSGAGTDTIVISGVKKLTGGEYEPIPDRIVGATYLCACAIAGGDITLDGFIVSDNVSVIEKLALSGCEISTDKNGKKVRVKKRERLKSISKIETQPFPGFPTDMQAQFVAMLSSAEGSSIMVENLFESRYRYTLQLVKMGAKITVKDRVAAVRGVKKLHGATVKAEDLRGGAALVLAALGAEGRTIIEDVRHIDRGYDAIERDLSLLGAKIERKWINKRSFF